MSGNNAGLLAVIITAAFIGLCILPVWINRRRQGRKVFEPVYQDIGRLKEKQQRSKIRAEARLNGVPTCPRCGSTAISAHKRGYNLGRGLFWGLALGFTGFWLFAIPGALIGFAVGLTLGSVGSQAAVATCVSCGHQYSPTVRRFLDELR